MEGLHEKSFGDAILAADTPLRLLRSPSVRQAILSGSIDLKGASTIVANEFPISADRGGTDLKPPEGHQFNATSANQPGASFRIRS